MFSNKLQAEGYILPFPFLAFAVCHSIPQAASYTKKIKITIFWYSNSHQW